MLKRLIGVITVKNGWAVQSIGYKQHLPLGRAETIAENFDRWKMDEILVIDIDRSRAGEGPNFQLLEKITSKSLATPLCYMGGICGPSDALSLVNSGADRVAVDSLCHKDPEAFNEISVAVGRQAVIVCIKVSSCINNHAKKVSLALAVVTEVRRQTMPT